MGVALANGNGATATAEKEDLVGAAKVMAASNSSWSTWLAGAFALLGAYKQYDMYEQQGKLANAQAAAVKQNMETSLKTFNEMIKPAFDSANAYFYGYYRNWGRGIIEKVVECGTRYCEYEANYDRFTPAIISDVARAISGAKRAGRRSLGCYDAGECCDQDFRFASLQASLVVDSVNIARRYEDERKMKYDTFYWNRMAQSAQISQNEGNLAATMYNNGRGAVLSGLQVLTQATSAADSAVQSQMGALGQQANFFGGMSGLAGSVLGTQYGSDVGNQLLMAGRPSTLLSSPNGPGMNIPGLPSSITTGAVAGQYTNSGSVNIPFQPFSFGYGPPNIGGVQVAPSAPLITEIGF